MIVLRTPKGWTCPPVVDGQQVEGTFRAHQVPLPEARTNDEHRRVLEAWMRSYRPEELFDEDGAPISSLRDLPPTGDRRMSANPVANGGLLLKALDLPDWRDAAVPVDAPGTSVHEPTRVLGGWLRDVTSRNLDNFLVFAPDELVSNRLQDVLDVTGRRWELEVGRVRRSPRSAGPRGGGALRAHLPGVARGLPPHRPPRCVHLLRGVHPHHRLHVQPTRQVARVEPAPSVATATRQPQLPDLLTRLASGPQRVQSPGSRVPRRRPQQEARDRPRRTSRPTPTRCCRPSTTASGHDTS